MTTSSPKPTPTPRCVIIRHGQTEWSVSGQYTGKTDLPLTEKGEKLVCDSAEALFRNNLLNPDHITYVFTSPRQRSIKTMELMLSSLTEEQKSKIKVVVDDDLQEWDYGDYEGKLTSEIRELRKSRGLDKERPWVIWRDGCEGGESSDQVAMRVSRAIARIQSLHDQHLKQGITSDILVFAHGHLLRYFAAIWTGLGEEAEMSPKDAAVRACQDPDVPHITLEKYHYMHRNPKLMLDAGGVGVLSYEHNNCAEPAMVIAGPFTVN
ncbi:hypothetical protein ZYGR_0N01420 [Zygosaccharomyces rouxii]|uniref:ZYRO0D03652p n=2 Tax=Zygosaccharomyces rouxii TaxID=4956 RepID=C5DV40_ZYGRC|nr:uncharacterized protein ZYRO0D03652g [Zygosaccharomyces rouxii]KAH9200573.1 histidine phosphatase superfamily [Zygosaccharomyces rouxii]GAV48738.1 hypothetical protein ZYGR_0N01420 [Zygosaccharomyces rouxii]CAR27659.1 ZYRO0D03652p [Zygosaccharomyces rouxii]